MEYAVGVDIGGSHICSGVVSLETRQIIGSSVREAVVDSRSRAGDIITRWSETIKSALMNFNKSVIGIGWAFPGPFDYGRGISLISGVDKFESIFGLDVTATLRVRLQDVTRCEFRYVNDAGAFALGEANGGAATGFSRVLVLTLGTGLGSGFIINGELITSGEDVPENGWVYNMPFDSGIADDAFSTRWCCSRYAELSGCRLAGVKEIVEKITSDGCAVRVLKEYGERLGRFLLPICFRFRADAIVLGGNISKAFPYFGTDLHAALKAGGLSIPVFVSQLHDCAAMVGAASLFLNK